MRMLVCALFFTVLIYTIPTNINIMYYLPCSGDIIYPSFVYIVHIITRNDDKACYLWHGNLVLKVYSLHSILLFYVPMLYAHCSTAVLNSF